MLGLLWQWAYGCWTNDIPMSMQRRFSRCSSWLSQEMAHRGKTNDIGRLSDNLRCKRRFFFRSKEEISSTRARARGEEERSPPPSRVLLVRSKKTNQKNNWLAPATHDSYLNECELGPWRKKSLFIRTLVLVLGKLVCVAGGISIRVLYCFDGGAA